MLDEVPMKFLESTHFFVRTVLFDFENSDQKIKLKFRLIPMVHIGSQTYYQQVRVQLEACDEILYEGVHLKATRLITRQYKNIAKKLNLVTQNEHLSLRGLEAKLVHADYNKKSGKQAWRELRPTEKIKLALIIPATLFVQNRLLTREILAKKFMTSAEEDYLAYGPVPDEKGTAENLILNAREQIIFKHINRKMQEDTSTEKVIGIIYGAAHMKKIARYIIDKHGYIPRSGSFLKVFDID